MAEGLVEEEWQHILFKKAWLELKRQEHGRFDPTTADGLVQFFGQNKLCNGHRKLSRRLYLKAYNLKRVKEIGVSPQVGQFFSGWQRAVLFSEAHIKA